MSNFRSASSYGIRPNLRLMSGGGAAPGPSATGHRTTGGGGGELDRRRVLILGIARLTMEAVGVDDMIPFVSNTIQGLANNLSRWMDIELDNLGKFPCIGDLAAGGTLGRDLRNLEDAIDLTRRDADFTGAAAPVLQRLKRAFDLLPESSNPSVNQIKYLADHFHVEYSLVPLPELLPNIAGSFVFNTVPGAFGYVHKYGEGRLGIPGKVQVHRSRYEQRKVSGGSGDHAGHLFADRFGAPGDERNLTLQNKNINTYSDNAEKEGVGQGGSFYELEGRWDVKLKAGWGIQAKVTDVISQGNGRQRPIGRRVRWTEISPLGERTPCELDLLNPHSVSSREKQGVAPTVDGTRPATVHSLDEQRNKKK